MTSAVETRHGRRGGGWITAGDQVAKRSRPCQECGRPMTCDQPGRHWSCCPTCPGLPSPGRPQGPELQLQQQQEGEPTRMTDTITTDPPTDLVPLAFPVAVVDHVSPEHLPAWAVVTRMPEPAGVTGEHSVIHIRHDDDLPLDGIVAIAAERARQVIHARFTPAWDHVHHPDGSLARMARDILDDYLQDGDGDDTLELRRTRLAHAGAFIAAELDRLTDLEVNG